MSSNEVIMHPEVIEFKGAQFSSIWSDNVDGFLFSSKNTYQASGSFTSVNPMTTGKISLNRVQLGDLTDTIDTINGLYLQNTSMSNIETLTFRPGGSNNLLQLNYGNIENINGIRFQDGMYLYGNVIDDVTTVDFTNGNGVVNLNGGTYYTRAASDSTGLRLAGTQITNAGGVTNNMTLQGIVIGGTGGQTVSLGANGAIHTTDSATAGLSVSGTLLGHTLGPSNEIFVQGITIGGTNGRNISLNSGGTLYTNTSGNSGLTISGTTIVNSTGTSNAITLQQVQITDRQIYADTLTELSGTGVDIEGSVFTGTNATYSGSRLTTETVEVSRIESPSTTSVIEFDGSRLSNLGLPINLNDAVTIQYLRNQTDNALQGLKPKEAVTVASVASDLFSGGTRTFDWDSAATNVYTDPSGNTDSTNVLPNGVLIIGDSSGNVTFDGFEVSVGDRILIKDFSLTTNYNLDRDNANLDSLNGIWVVKSKNGHGSGATMTPTTGAAFTGAAISLRRADDMNSNIEVMNGAYTYCTNGTTQKDNAFVVTNPDPITLINGQDTYISTASTTGNVLNWALFNNASSSINMGQITNGSSTLSTATNIHSRWQGIDATGGSQAMTSGAVLMRAFGDNNSTIATDATLLSFNKSFATGGRYNDSTNTTLLVHNIDFMNTTLYTDDGSSYSGNNVSIHNASETTAQRDVSNDYCLSIKGHIVLEESGLNRPGTINKVEFHPNGDVYTNANIEASSLTAFSDRRLKKNINDIENPIDLVHKLRGVTFNWNVDEICDAPQYGFIGQEVAENFPTLVNQNKSNGILSVDYMKICSILCSAVQELSKEVKDLKSKLT